MEIAAQIHIVDDDEMLAEMLLDYLHSQGYHNIGVFNTGEAFLQELKSTDNNSPLIIILDYNLNTVYPNAANGLEILKAIQNENNDQISVIMYSSQSQYGEALDLINNQAKGLIKKDLQGFIELDKIIKTLLNKKHGRN